MEGSDQSWVTLALSETDVWEALVLAKSIKKTLTSRKLTALISEDLGGLFRDLLWNVFDLVIPIETKNLLSKGLDRNQIGKLWCCKLRIWAKCVFVKPNALVLSNCDALFDFEGKKGRRCSTSSIFGVKPNIAIFNKALGILDSAANKENLNNGLDEIFAKVCFPYQGKILEQKNGTLVQLESTENFSRGQLFEFNGRPWIFDFGGNEDFGKHWQQSFVQDILSIVENEKNPKIRNALEASISTNQLPSDKVDIRDLSPGLALSQDYRNSIAVIGMSCRFAGANNPAEFWNVLKKGVSGICEYPDGRPQAVIIGDGSSNPFKAGYLKCPVDEFDAKFFKISPKEAPFVDPQQRLVLEVAWEALEVAGINPTTLKGTNTAAFLGIWQQDYNQLFPLDGLTGNEFHHRYLGNALSAISARLSYFLGLHGPNVAMESGCSSSLAGLHLACESLRRGETGLAISSGVNLILTSSNPLSGNADTIVLSKDHLCKTFDESADGFVRAEGCGVLILKRCAQAVADGDNILAVIRGSAYNNDGMGTSFGTPNALAQTRVIHEALKNSGVDAGEVSYVEAHGTGTAVGDPTEMWAIGKGYAIKEGKQPRVEPLMVGSVKTNIGHAESCAGMAGVFKVILAMQNNAIPPHLNLKTLNHRINLEEIPARIPVELTEWKGTRRIAGVSSFSMSGTNVHVLIQEPPQILRQNHQMAQDAPASEPQLFTISAKTEEALEEMTKDYVEFLQANPNVELTDVAYFVNTGRAHLSHGIAVIAKDCADLAKRLESRNFISGRAPSAKNKVAFLFTGQGSQYFGMAKKLYGLSPAFRTALDACDALFKTYLKISIQDVLWKNDELLKETIYCQPSIFCVQYALLQHWAEFEITPDYVVGHSVGEFCAAVSAGILSLSDAMKLVVQRSRLVNSLPGGNMLAVQQPFAKVKVLIAQFNKSSKTSTSDFWVDVAAVNSAEEVVVSTSPKSAEAFMEFCANNGVKTLAIPASHAFHSRAMDSILKEFGEIASTVTHGAPTCTYVSGTLAKEMELKDLSSEYWVRHLRDTVRFADAIVNVGQSCKIFLEIGTQPILLALTMANVGDTTGMTFCPSLRRSDDDWVTGLTTLSKLFVAGVDIDWNKWYGPRQKPSFAQSMPTYRFQRQKYWYEGSDDSDAGSSTSGGGVRSNGRLLHPILGRQMPAPVEDRIFFNSLRVKSLPYMEDHKVAEKIIMPAAGYLEVMMAAGLQVLQGGGSVSVPLTIQDFQVEAALCMDTACHVQTIVATATAESSDSEGVQFNVSIHKQVERDDPEKWKRHASATFSPSINLPKSNVLDLNEVKGRLEVKGSMAEIYSKIASVGIDFGPSFQSIVAAWNGPNEVLTEINWPEGSDSYICHPIVLDAMIQTFAFRTALVSGEQKELMLPISIKKFTWLSGTTPTPQVFAFSSWEETTQGEGAVYLYSQDGELLAIMEGLTLLSTDVSSFLRALRSDLKQLPGFLKEIWRPALPIATGRVDLTNWSVDSTMDEYPTIAVDLHEEATSKHMPPCNEADRLIFIYWLKTIQECGWYWPTQVGGKIRVEDWKTPENTKILFPGFLENFLANMMNEGYVDPKTSTVTQLLPTIPECEEMIKATTTKYLNLSGDNVTLRFIQRCGDNISNVLHGKMTPLALLFPEDSSEVGAIRYYSESNFYVFTNDYITEVIIQSILRLNKVEGGILRILEVGAGSASTTIQLIKRLIEHGIPYHYVYTDISPLLVAQSRQKLDKNVACEVLNIEEDPLSQGFMPEAYDLVIAANVLHATQDLAQALAHCNLLLKPGGLIALGEQLTEVYKYSLTFGLLEGWWRFKDFRKTGPMVDGATWESLLKATGFDHVLCFSEMEDSLGAIRATKRILASPTTLLPQPQPKTWIIFPDDSSISSAICQKLMDVNRRVVLVRRDANLTEITSTTTNQYIIPSAATPEQYKTLIETILGQGEDGTKVSHLEGVLFMHSDSAPAHAHCIEDSQHSIARTLLLTCQSVLAVTQSTRSKPKIVVVTRGIHYIGDSSPGDPSKATSWGILKVFGNENPEIQTCSVDLDQLGCPESEELTEVFSQLWPTDREQYIALRTGGKKYNLRLAYAEKPLVSITFPNINRFEVINPTSGAFSDLEVGPALQREIIDDKVEVAVEACALNFRDVLVILKPEGFKLPEGQVWDIGLEVSGTVTSVGPGVKRLAVGDEVFGFGSTTGLASHVVGTEKGFMRKPKTMTFTGAATLPVAFGTAYYALVDLAKINSTDRVLIHVASGGVGLAAVQICQSVGAEIYATAGSHRKRTYLRSLGITKVYHSRNTDYGKKILRDSAGAGVTIVLNSLTGPNFKEESLNACAIGAKFIEIGKINTWKVEEVAVLRPDVKYDIIDLGSILTHSPDETKKLCEAMEANFETSTYTPLPHSTFALEQCRQAFYYFQEAKHIGKIVVTIPKPRPSGLKGKMELKSHLFNKESTYLITGGLGGLGMEVANWMTTMGAGAIVLVGRNPPTPPAQNLIDKWNSDGSTSASRVVTFQADVSTYAACADVLNKIKEMGLPPLRGIIHAAGIVSDAIIVNQTWENYETVFGPKVYGGWHLHELTKTKEYDLEFFVMFSTAGVIAGAIGQSNHVAANFYLDSLAQYRVSIGLPATTINWGSWSDVGAAAKIKLGMEGAIGIRSFSPAQGIAALERIFRDRLNRAIVLDVSDWNVFKSFFSHGHYTDEISAINSSGGREKLEDYKKLMAEIKALPQEEWQGKFQEFLTSVMRQTLRLPETEAIDIDQNFSELGVDSLMAMEMRNRLQAVLEGKTLTVSALQENRTIRSLSTHLSNLLKDDGSGAPTLPPLEELLILDAILPSDVKIEDEQNNNKPTAPLKPSQFRKILLTGATGHLGSNVLSELTQRPEDLTIYCLVRASTKEEGEERLIAMLSKQNILDAVELNRVEIVIGDIVKDKFGLVDEEYEELSTTIDAIIHCAAKSNHLENYNEEGLTHGVRSTNVLGLVNIIRFAGATRTKPLFHASTLIAATEISGDDGMITEEYPDMTMTGVGLQNGYMQSKFVGEKLIAQGEALGIPTTSIRYPVILGNSVTGVMPIEYDHGWTFLTTCMKLQKFPKFSQGISMVPVDVAAKITLLIFLNDEADRGLYNLTTETTATESVIKDVAREFKINPVFVPFTEWREQLSTEDLENGAMRLFMEAYKDQSEESAEQTVHPLAPNVQVINFDTFSKKMAKNVKNIGEILPSAKDLLHRHLKTHFAGMCRKSDEEESDVDIDELTQHMLG